MSGILFQHAAQETDFTKPLKRAVLRDARLSWGARGLFSFIWDLPNSWECHKSHLVEMSPGGRSRLNGLISELQAVGAIKIEPRRLSEAEAIAATAAATAKGLEKNYKAGQVLGWRWIIKHPDTWAVESPLSTTYTTTNPSQSRPKPKSGFPTYGKPDLRKNRLTGNPCDGKPTPKVLQYKGSEKEGYPIEAEAETLQKNAAAPGGEIKKPSIPPKQKVRSHSSAGVECWNEEDKDESTRLEERHGVEKVMEVVEKLKEEGVKPLPSRVVHALQPHKDCGTSSVPPNWWATEATTVVAGSALGVAARPGEDWSQYRQRISAQLQQPAPSGAVTPIRARP